MGDAMLPALHGVVARLGPAERYYSADLGRYGDSMRLYLGSFTLEKHVRLSPVTVLDLSKGHLLVHNVFAIEGSL